MEILRTISFYTRDKDMPFLIIGGHAVNHYGISRQTGDLDFLVPFNSKIKWQKLLSELNYQEFQSTSTFSRFRFNELASWPIDLMYVDESTFQKMQSAAEEGDFGVTTVKVVSIEHLILLKISALKIFQEHRFAKDYSDLISLLKKHTINSVKLENYCKKYATQELFRRLQADIDLKDGKNG